MSGFAHGVYLAFLPSIGLGLALSVAWRFVRVGHVRTALQWIASLLFFVPMPFALWLGAYSSGLRLYQQALLSLVGFGVSALMINKLRSQRPHRRFALALGAVAMGGLGIYCGWTTLGDYALRHDIVTGTVEGARVIRGTRSPSTYEVFINGKGYNVTWDLLSQMSPGDYIEAEVGVASHTIVSIRRAIHRSRAGGALDRS